MMMYYKQCMSDALRFKNFSAANELIDPIKHAGRPYNPKQDKAELNRTQVDQLVCIVPRR